MNHNRFKSDLAYIDMLANMMVVLAFLVSLAFMLIKVESEQAKKVPELKAEFIITMTWPDESFDDVDLWVLLPSKKRVGFTSRDVDGITLDRDDRGAYGDIFYDALSTPHLIKLNKEIITMRAINPGRYVVNVHAYAQFLKVGPFVSTTTYPFKVKVVLTKVNPTVVDAITQEVELVMVGQQATAFSFTINDDGSISDVDKEDQLPFVDSFSHTSNADSFGPPPPPAAPNGDRIP